MVHRFKGLLFQGLIVLLYSSKTTYNNHGLPTPSVAGEDSPGDGPVGLQDSSDHQKATGGDDPTSQKGQKDGDAVWAERNYKKGR